MKKLTGYIFLSLFVLISCTTAKKEIQRNISMTTYNIQNNVVFKDHITGFSLYDPKVDKKLIDINGDKLFTPASNTKLLTFLTAINILEDSAHIINYQTKGFDTLIFTGTAYPLSLNPEVGNDTSLIRFLKKRKEKLFYCDQHQLDKFGSGWAWDDVAYSYQRELSSLPLYGNAIHITHHLDSTSIFPNTLKNLINISAIDQEVYHQTQYFISLDTSKYDNFIPIYNYSNEVPKLLSDIIEKPIFNCPINDLKKYTHTLKGTLPDSVYIRLLHQSDNFIAEQLLLMCSNEIFDTLKTSKIIQYAKDNYMPFKGERMVWVDGSGLSRYNLISPNMITKVLFQILDKIKLKRVKKLFPAGGESGTIQDWYFGDKSPYIYAKTGTLSNNHNLSGYIITKKNNLLLFSFMHNHYIGASYKVKKQMEIILNNIYENF